jgi:hypothetical protein
LLIFTDIDSFTLATLKEGLGEEDNFATLEEDLAIQAGPKFKRSDLDCVSN